MYTVLGIFFLFIVQRLILQGPSPSRTAHDAAALSSA
jgi:hypothetical protein